MKQRGSRTRRTPRWAVLCAVFGALLMVGSGTVLVVAQFTISRVNSAITEGDLFGDGETPEPGDDIEGPLNVLVAGLDTRPSRPEDLPLADSLLIAHIPAGLDRAYLISIPRDAWVEIPPFPETGYPGGTAKINSAMSAGAQQIGDEELPNLERGFQLLEQTVRNLTGIESFDAGAVLKFQAFEGIVDAMNGVTVELDQTIVSRHRQPDGTHRPLGCGSYCGPQMVYEPGSPPCEAAEEPGGSFDCHLNGWQALDVSRQRYGVEDSDYGRQRNQQKIMRAMMEKAFSRDVVTDPLAINRLLDAAGDAMIFAGRGHEVVDYGFALRDLRPSSLTTVTLTGGAVSNAAGEYLGEQLTEESMGLFEALRQGELDHYLLEHSDLISA